MLNKSHTFLFLEYFPEKHTYINTAVLLHSELFEKCLMFTIHIVLLVCIFPLSLGVNYWDKNTPVN